LTHKKEGSLRIESTIGVCRGEHSREANISTIPSPILIFSVIRLEFVLGETKNSPAAKFGHLRLLFLNSSQRKMIFQLRKALPHGHNCQLGRDKNLFSKILENGLTAP
jgi:hypothetical protein